MTLFSDTFFALMHFFFLIQILRHMRHKGPLDPPEGCPDWVNIIIHQCWAYESVQRPPFLAIFDCLTSRYFKHSKCDVA